MSSDYVEELKEPREAWIAGYFSWEEEVMDIEIHTARDGFDAGATWMQKKDIHDFAQWLAKLPDFNSEAMKTLADKYLNDLA